MAKGNADTNYRRRRADSYTPQGNRVYSRAAYPAYEPHRPNRRNAPLTTPAKENEEDYHPVVPLKTLTPAEIRAISLVVFIVTAVAMFIIFLAAEAAMTQKEINDLKRGIAQVDDDIANLKIEIEQSQNMQLVKKRASEELGMKEPSFDQYVYISDLPTPMTDFGRYIKERAYGVPRSSAEPTEHSSTEEPEEEQ
jgi:cell division protein FtsL